MARDKYHAELRFHSRKVRFTSEYLDRLLKRFNDEVAAEVARSTEAREYVYIVPSLIVEHCRSWSEFDQYEHAL